jgi:shikimate dehydrogenase
MSERFILIGHPVGHSLSPALHAAAYQRLGREARYELVDAPQESDVVDQVRRLREGTLRGANVTVPWKRLALALADRVDPSALAVGAANVLARADDGAIVAHNTDAPGLAGDLTALLEEAGGWQGKRSALVIGNGGAALGAVVACQLAGAERVLVVARAFRGEEQATWARGEEFRRLGAHLLAWPITAGASEERSFAAATAECRLIVQATSAGMHGADSGETVAGLVPFEDLSHVAAYDLVYNPADTPFLTRARAHGHAVRGGLGMLVRQAALAIEIWWGTLPPLEPLLDAATRALAAKTAQGTSGGVP